MKKIAFYSKQCAKQCAEEIAKSCNGYIESKLISLNCDDVEDVPEEIDQWAGEMSAFSVVDESSNIVAVVGYWD